MAKKNSTQKAQEGGASLQAKKQETRLDRERIVELMAKIVELVPLSESKNVPPEITTLIKEEIAAWFRNNPALASIFDGLANIQLRDDDLMIIEGEAEKGKRVRRPKLEKDELFALEASKIIINLTTEEKKDILSKFDAGKKEAGNILEIEKFKKFFESLAQYKAEAGQILQSNPNIIEQIEEVKKKFEKAIEFDTVRRRRKRDGIEEEKKGDISELLDYIRSVKIDSSNQKEMSVGTSDAGSKTLSDEGVESVDAVSEGDVRVIGPKELRTNLVCVLDEVLKGYEYIIRRRKKEVARIIRYNPASDTSSEEEVVSTTELNRKLGSLIDQARSGVRLVIKRSGNKIAELRPPLPQKTDELSDEEKEKLLLTRDIPLDQLRIALKNNK